MIEFEQDQGTLLTAINTESQGRSSGIGKEMIAQQQAETLDWRDALIHLGPWRATFAITGFSILVSAAISVGISFGIGLRGIALLHALELGVVVPAVVAPLACHSLVRLLGELKDAHALLKELAIHDGLTHAFNRQHFMGLLGVEMKRAAREGVELSLVLLDADNFKSINDRYGHSVGDRVLQEITRVCKGILRPYDVFARYGGEEFIAMMPNVTESEACAVAERIRVAVESLNVQTASGGTVAVTVSLGVSSLMNTDVNVSSLLDRADAAMYEAKRAGRNRWAC